ncbi:unnamed protein product [Choristocarpus tenellus]
MEGNGYSNFIEREDRDGFRRRQTGGYGSRQSVAQSDSEDSALVRKVKMFDVYARVDEDLGVKTESGAAVTVGFWILMLLMVWGEVSAYLEKIPDREHLVIDPTMGQKLRINLNITFHAISCLDLHLDAMDVAGENQMDIEHGMLKQRLTSSGIAVGDAFREVPSKGDPSLEVPSDYCGSCYGAGDGCCNTCKELSALYIKKGWTAHEIRRTAEQCIRENHLETPLEEGEGCRLSGFMLVNKVAGNFHVAAGEGMMRMGRHIHQYNAEEAKTFNVSHSIHQLSFGDPYPGMGWSNPLDGLERVIDREVGTGLFQYFIKLVPTVYPAGMEEDRTITKDGDTAGGQLMATNMSHCQFAYTQRFRSIFGFTEYHQDHPEPIHHEAHGEATESEPANQQRLLLPGVFFVYDVSPFMVEVRPSPSLPLSHLLIRLCAVAGGAFAVSSMLDGVLFYFSNRIKRKGLLG